MYIHMLILGEWKKPNWFLNQKFLVLALVLMQFPGCHSFCSLDTGKGLVNPWKNIIRLISKILDRNPSKNNVIKKPEIKPATLLADSF